MPGDAVFDDVERLARNLVAMNGILRDRSQTSIRLVMNPERMVVKEAMRTFTYLNLYGYLTDAVVVNRVLPPDAAAGYFEAWREAQQEHLDLVRSAFAPLPILEAPFFDREVVGPEMLDRAGREASSGSSDPAELFHHELEQELATDNGRATLRVPLPFAERGEIELKKIGLEVIVRVGGQKRTIILPPADVRLRHERRALRGGRASNLLREGRGCARTALDPDRRRRRKRRPAADRGGRLRRRRGRRRGGGAAPAAARPARRIPRPCSCSSTDCAGRRRASSSSRSRA